MCTSVPGCTLSSLFFCGRVRKGSCWVSSLFLYAEFNLLRAGGKEGKDLDSGCTFHVPRVNETMKKIDKMINFSGRCFDVEAVM